MLTRFIRLLVLFAPLASALILDSINPPTPFSGTAINISFTSEANDDFTFFFLSLSDINVAVSLVIANNIPLSYPGYNATITITLPIVPPGSEYFIFGDPVPPAEFETATFGPFSILATPSVSVSSVTTTGTGNTGISTNPIATITSTPNPTSAASTTDAVTTTSEQLNVGAVVGGVVGGFAFVVILIVAGLTVLRRRNLLVPTRSTYTAQSQAMMSGRDGPVLR